MPEIPIFDSLTHPTPSGEWIPGSGSGPNSLTDLLQSMAETNVQWAFAVGMPGIGGYDPANYAAWVRQHSDALYPVAGIASDDLDPDGVRTGLITELKRLGYVGVKIHPRRLGVPLTDPRIAGLIAEANRRRILPMVCTYFCGGQAKHRFEYLEELLERVKGCKLVLLHGGTVRLLETIEIARAYPDVLLDLSFTLCKYEASSLDLDIQYAFRRFDRRICIGSDSPEFDLHTMRGRFEALSAGATSSQRENIAYRNLSRYVTEW
ncbi:amidohydrolase family protein [Cohnella sp. CFH 77786]|uniref:amidohydrolase family protein n=1 Tax=Cohnella sp. CFH 77786 TaxID=2662265 RepID=UPI001C60AEFE|nr:amidohydrolase family protein [Cohnella sp. CFH 77786]MBW5444641.1 amidohydrolase family protein [Cohnella sp. CFH 77786]